MARKLAKTILSVGNHVSPDGTLVVTRERLKHWAEQHARLKANRQVVPMHFDHSDSPDLLKPISLGELSRKKTRSARNTIGQMPDFKLSADGNSAEITIATSDKTAKRGLLEGDLFVSPVVIPKFRDGAGNEYTDIIGTLDVVNFPVDHKQGPAKLVADSLPTIACAIRLGANVYRLMAEMDDDDPEKKKKDAETVMEPGGGESDEDIADSILNSKGAKPDSEGTPTAGADNPASDSAADGELAEDDYEAENNDFSDIEGEDGEELDDGPEGIGNEVEITEEQVGGLPGLIQGLDTFGITLPVDTDETNFVDRLFAAVSALNGPPEDGIGGGPEDLGGDMVENPQIMTMSLQDRNRVQYADRLHREKIEADLKELLKTGRCEPHEFKARSAELGTVRLSLDDTGTPISSKVEEWIANRKPVPAGTFWTDEQRITRLSAPVEHPAPKAYGEDAGSEHSAQSDAELAREILNAKKK